MLSILIRLTELFIFLLVVCHVFFFSSRRRHTRSTHDWSSDVCSSDLTNAQSHPPNSPFARSLPGPDRHTDDLECSAHCPETTFSSPRQSSQTRFHAGKRPAHRPDQCQ